MTTNSKTEIVQRVAEHAAQKSLQQAKSSSGWARVLWGLGTAIAAAVAWLCGTASQNQPEPATDEPAICVPEVLADSVAE
jgi:hypothetical protein